MTLKNVYGNVFGPDYDDYARGFYPSSEKGEEADPGKNKTASKSFEYDPDKLQRRRDIIDEMNEKNKNCDQPSQTAFSVSRATIGRGNSTNNFMHYVDDAAYANSRLFKSSDKDESEYDNKPSDDDDSPKQSNRW